MKSIRNVLFETLVAGGAVLGAAGGVSVANAQDASTATINTAPVGGEHWHRHQGGPWHMFRHLGLTADQKASMKSIMTAVKPQMQSLHEQMRAQMYAVLTPAQKTQLASQQAQWEAKAAARQSAQ